MNHASRPSLSRFRRLGGASLLALAAACGKLDHGPLGPAPAASGGVAGWVVNGEAGDASSSGGSSAGRGNDRPAPSTAGTTGAGGTMGGNAGSGSGSGSSSSTTGGAGSGAGAGGASAGGASGNSGSGGSSMVDPRGGEGGLGAEVSPPKVHAFRISEYVEGSSNNKAIELHASEASTLDGCQLDFYFNGGFEPAAVKLEGHVPAGQAYVVCTEELGVQITPRCARVASLRFNGNDAVSLACDGVILDTIGKVGDDPGKGWGSGDTMTVDHTLRRRCDAAPEPTLNDDFDPALGWESFPVDSFEDLGRHVCPPDEGEGGAPGHDGHAGFAGEASGAAGEAGAMSVELE
jgi:hypothetical protein